MSDEEETENIESLKNEIQKQQTEIEWRKERIEKLEKELASVKSASMKGKKEAEKSNKKIEQLSTENEDLKNQVTELNSKIEQLATEALENELKESKELIAEQNQKIEELNHQITTITNESTEKNSTIEEQNSQLDKNKEEIDALNEKLKTSENTLSENENMITSLNSSIEKLKDGLKEAEGLLLQQKSQMDEATSGIKDAQDVLLSKDETLTNLNQTVKEQQDKISELELSDNKKEIEIQELQTKFTELETSLKSKEEDIQAKDEKIEELQKRTDEMEAGVDLYQSTNKELKDKLETQKEEIKARESKKEVSEDISKYEKMLSTKDKTIDLLKKEIADLTEKLQVSEAPIEEISAGEAKDFNVKRMAEILEDKVSPEEQNKIILSFQEKEARIENLSSLTKRQKSELDKNTEEIEKFKSETNKQKIELNKLKSELKDKEKAVKQLGKNLDRSKKAMQNLESEVDIESAITKVEKTKKTKAHVDESTTLRDRIESLEETLELEKDENAKLKEKCLEFEKSTDAQAVLQQKNAYEAYILTLQTELYDIKHQFQESESLRNEQQVHIERLEALMVQVQAMMDETEKARSPETLFEKVSRISEQSQSLLSAKPSVEPLLGYKQSSEPLLGTKRSSERLLGAEPSSKPLLGTQIDLSGQETSEERDLLTNRPLSPSEKLEHQRNDGIMKIFSNLTTQNREIKDMALVGFGGELYFQTSPWDIQSDLFKLIQDWKAEASSVRINNSKYATMKATDEILVATNVQGKGHILCMTVDEKLFIIIYLDIQGDALLLSDDIKPVLPNIKNIFEEYEKSKTQLL